jgi:hypothetical protein
MGLRGKVMNIFALHIDPKTCASLHADKHVVKMILETAQMLCAAHEIGYAPYKRTHYNHPCTQWARKTTANYDWLCRLGLALCDEYTRRYGRRHKSQDVIEWCEECIPDAVPLGELTPFAQAMPDEFKHVDDPIQAYKAYYRYKIETLQLKYEKSLYNLSIL